MTVSRRDGQEAVVGMFASYCPVGACCDEAGNAIAGLTVTWSVASDGDRNPAVYEVTGNVSSG